MATKINRLYDYQEVKEAIETLKKDGASPKESEGIGGWREFVFTNKTLFPTGILDNDHKRFQLYQQLEDDFN